MLSLRSHFAICGVASLILFATASRSFAGGVLFVDDDAPPSGDGITWDTAYRFLQDALADASGGGVMEIRAGQGTYKPDRDEANPEGTGDREATFQLINGVALMGGYAGVGAPDPDAHDIAAFETILSGDLLGDDEAFEINNAENSLHVVTGSGTDATARIEGLTITAGNADGFNHAGGGGGFFNVGGSPTVDACTISANFGTKFSGGMFNTDDAAPTISNCTFVGNSGRMGGALNNTLSAVVLSNCLFTENVCNVLGGAGGAITQSVSDAWLSDCLFLNNTSDFGAGAIFASGTSNITFERCEFAGNLSELNGGAIMVNIGAHTRFFQCTFTDNLAEGIEGGGAIWSRQDLILDRCVFSQNVAASQGGALFLEQFNNSTIVGCVFDGNSAGFTGGAIHDESHNDTPVIINSVFMNNTSMSDGGAIANSQSNPLLINCTIVANSALSGGAMHSDLFSLPSLKNCIVWGNEPDQIVDAFRAVTTVDHSIVEGGWSGAGSNNLMGTPIFVGPDVDDYRLQDGSPGIDAGDNSSVPSDLFDYDGDGDVVEPIPLDLAGESRFVDDPMSSDCQQAPGACGDPPVVDMGAYEFQLPCPWDVSGDGVVDHHDLVEVVHNLGLCNDPDNCPWDVNGDGIVNGRDVVAVARHFGACP